MEDTDKKIFEHDIARQVGLAVSRWMKKNSIDADVDIQAVVSKPTMYIDETGAPHGGQLVVVDVNIREDEDYDDDDDDD